MVFRKYKVFGIAFCILLFVIAVFVNNVTFTIICGSIIIAWFFGLIPVSLIQNRIDNKVSNEYQQKMEEREQKIDKALDKFLQSQVDKDNLDN